MAIETGWLIELNIDGQPHWWSPKKGETPAESGWSTMANDAIRYARKHDAQMVIDEIGWTEVTATEHQWGPDESDPPEFTIKGSDRGGPETILDWVARAGGAGVHAEKLTGAFQIYLNMIKWQSKYPELVHTPD